MNEQNFTEATPINELTPEQPRSGIIIMPERVDGDGVGYYGEQASAVYKDLVAMGAEVSYYTEKRKSIHRFSAGENELLTFVIAFFATGMLPTATYDVLKTYLLSKFKKKPNGKVDGKILISSDANGRSSWQEYKVTGSVDDAIKMIDKIKEIHDGDSTRQKSA